MTWFASGVGLPVPRWWPPAGPFPLPAASTLSSTPHPRPCPQRARAPRRPPWPVRTDHWPYGLRAGANGEHKAGLNTAQDRSTRPPAPRPARLGRERCLRIESTSLLAVEAEGVQLVVARPAK